MYIYAYTYISSRKPYHVPYPVFEILQVISLFEQKLNISGTLLKT